MQPTVSCPLIVSGSFEKNPTKQAHKLKDISCASFHGHMFIRFASNPDRSHATRNSGRYFRYFQELPVRNFRCEHRGSGEYLGLMGRAGRRCFRWCHRKMIVVTMWLQNCVTTFGPNVVRKAEKLACCDSQIHFDIHVFRQWGFKTEHTCEHTPTHSKKATATELPNRLCFFCWHVLANILFLHLDVCSIKIFSDADGEDAADNVLSMNPCVSAWDWCSPAPGNQSWLQNLRRFLAICAIPHFLHFWTRFLSDIRVCNVIPQQLQVLLCTNSEFVRTCWGKVCLKFRSHASNFVYEHVCLALRQQCLQSLLQAD